MLLLGAQALVPRTVVLRYRIHLECRHLAPGTINLRLGAVRRLAYEAADCGLLSPDLAAGIRRVKGVKKIGVRLGNWLTAEQSQKLWQAPGGKRLKEKRDRALLAILLACGLRRHEAVELNFGHLQQREEHWAIVDLKGKAGHTRTIPMPAWVKQILDQWLQAANITSGKLFRRVHKMGKSMGRKTDREGGLARGSGVRCEIEHRQVSAARPPQLCRISDYAEFHRSESVVTGGARKRFGIVGVVARDSGGMRTFINPNLLQRLRVGPLAPYLDAYLKHIEQDGFLPHLWQCKCMPLPDSASGFAIRNSIFANRMKTPLHDSCNVIRMLSTAASLLLCIAFSRCCVTAEW